MSQVVTRPARQPARPRARSARDAPLRASSPWSPNLAQPRRPRPRDLHRAGRGRPAGRPAGVLGGRAARRGGAGGARARPLRARQPGLRACRRAASWPTWRPPTSARPGRSTTCPLALAILAASGQLRAGGPRGRRRGGGAGAGRLAAAGAGRPRDGRARGPRGLAAPGRAAGQRRRGGARARLEVLGAGHPARRRRPAGGAGPERPAARSTSEALLARAPARSGPDIAEVRGPGRGPAGARGRRRGRPLHADDRPAGGRQDHARPAPARRSCRRCRSTRRSRSTRIHSVAGLLDAGCPLVVAAALPRPPPHDLGRRAGGRRPRCRARGR